MCEGSVLLQAVVGVGVGGGRGEGVRGGGRLQSIVLIKMHTQTHRQGY